MLQAQVHAVERHSGATGDILLYPRGDVPQRRGKAQTAGGLPAKSAGGAPGNKLRSGSVRATVSSDADLAARHSRHCRRHAVKPWSAQGAFLFTVTAERSVCAR